jgi:hypothetical protein
MQQRPQRSFPGAPVCLTSQRGPICARRTDGRAATPLGSPATTATPCRSGHHFVSALRRTACALKTTTTPAPQRERGATLSLWYQRLLTAVRGLLLREAWPGLFIRTTPSANRKGRQKCPPHRIVVAGCASRSGGALDNAARGLPSVTVRGIACTPHAFPGGCTQRGQAGEPTRPAGESSLEIANRGATASSDPGVLHQPVRSAAPARSGARRLLIW